MIVDKIKFQNKNFWAREIELAGIGNVWVSTVPLNKLLVNVYGSYVSEEAIFIDERIYYFVEDNEIMLPDLQLISLLNQQVND